MDNRVEGDTWSYIGKGLAHASVAGLAAAATTAFVIHGGRIAAGTSGWSGLSMLTKVGQFCIGASSYSFQQAIDNKPITSDILWAGFTNVISPVSTKPGTFISLNNMLSPNNLKVLSNQFISSSLGMLQVSNLLDSAISWITPHQDSGGGGYYHYYSSPTSYPDDSKGMCGIPQSNNNIDSIFNFHY